MNGGCLAMKKHWSNVYIAIIACVIYVIAPIYYNYFETGRPTDPRTKESMVMFANELDKLQLLPDSVFQGVDHFIKRDGVGYLTYSYWFDGHYENVLRHYDVQLKNKGWQYVEAGVEKYMWKETGLKFVRYKKDKLKISINFRERSSPLTEFGLTISNNPAN